MSTARPSSRLSIARSAPSFILAPAHAVEVNRRCLVGPWAWDFARAAATRSALCAVLVVVLRCVGCCSCLNGTGRSFCGLRQRARQRRPPATPASNARQRRPPATPASGPHEATTRLETSGLCPKSLPHAPCNNHSTPRLRIPRNATKAYFFVVSDDGPASLLTGSPTGPVFWPLAL